MKNQSKIPFLILVCLLLSCSPEEDSFLSSEAKDIQNRAAYLYFDCSVEHEKEGKRYTYKTAEYFNNDTEADSGNVEISMLLDIDGINREGFAVGKVGTDKWEKKGQYTLKLAQKPDGSKGISVFDHKRNHLAPVENSRCQQKNLFPGCPKYTADLDTNCIATGQANPDFIGDAIIETTLTLGMAGIFNLVKKGALRWVAKGAYSGGTFRIAAPTSATMVDGIAAQEITDEVMEATLNSSQRLFSNDAIIRQLNDVDEEMLNLLKVMSKGVEDSTTPMPVSSLAPPFGDEVKSISLGTAREFTAQTGREIAVVRNLNVKSNYYVIGAKQKYVDGKLVTGLDAQIPISSRGPAGAGVEKYRLLYHFHPKEASTPISASLQDVAYLVQNQQGKTFIGAVGEDMINQLTVPIKK